MSPTLRLVLVFHNHQPSATSTASSSRPIRTATGRSSTCSSSTRPADRAAHQRLADGMARRAASGIRRSPGGAGRGRAGSRSSAARSTKPILTMIPPRDRVGQITRYTDWLADRLRRADQRHVDARARLGAVAHQRPGRRRHGVHGARRLPLQERRPRRGPAARLLHHRGRRPSCSRSFPAASGCGTRFRSASRRRRSTTCAQIAEQQPGAVVVFGDDGEKFGSLARHEGARLRPRLAAAVLRRAVGQPRAGSASSRRPKRSTRCRRSARSICPKAAIAK